MLPLVFERVGAEKFGQMIREVLSAPYDLGDRNVRLSASFGFAIYPFAGEEFEDLLKSAETALYRSKRRGRGQITVYSKEIAQEMKRATQLEQALRNAIISNAIDVHFQPIVSLANNLIVGFEALARWNDADLAVASPVTFVPLVEQARLSTPFCPRDPAAQGGGLRSPAAVSCSFLFRSVLGAIDGSVARAAAILADSWPKRFSIRIDWSWKSPRRR